jgi:hypothetical protein
MFSPSFKKLKLRFHLHSSVGIAIPGRNKILFLFSVVSIPFLAPTQPPIQWVKETFPQEIKRPGREADRSPPSSVDFKNDAAMPPLPNMSFWSVLN